jgi:hypothetical protein
MLRGKRGYSALIELVAHPEVTRVTARLASVR